MKHPWLALALLVLSGCVGNTYYTVPPSRFDADAADAGYRESIRSCAEAAVRTPKPGVADLCHLAILEFDDQGEFWRPRQLTETLDLLHATSRPDQPALLVVFVHGWKNNASLANERRHNLASFNEVLMDLAAAQIERCKGGETRYCERPVVGIYMAWRGKTLRTPIGKSISYFPRRAAAERVARVSFSHALHRIVNHAKGAKSGDDPLGLRTRGNPETVVVVVGHSLGALILENTILRSLTHETDDFREDFPVDLAVFVNSANDAIITRQFIHALENAPLAPGPRKRLSLPLIVSLTSRGDWATRYLTPASQSVRRLGKSFRRYETDGLDWGRDEQLYYYKRTAAHSGPQAGILSHQVDCPLEAGGCATLPKSKRSSRREIRGQYEPPTDPLAPPAVRTVPCHEDRGGSCRVGELRCVDRLWFTDRTGETLYEVRPLAERYNDSFYWVLQVPESLVPDHSRIFQADFVSLVAALVTLQRGQEVEDVAQAAERLLLPDGAGELPGPDAREGVRTARE